MAQEKTGFIPDFRLSQSTLVSSGEDLPFWMVANQNGVYTMHNPSYFLTQAGIKRSLEHDASKNWGYTYGVNPARAELARVPASRVNSESRGTERSYRIWRTLLYKR